MTGALQLRNEFIIAPIKTGYGTTTGEVTQAHITWYNRISKYAGAVIPEPFYLDPTIRELPVQIGIDNDDKLPGLTKLVNTIHANNAKAIAHLNHAGRLANPKLPKNRYLSSSAVSCPSYGTTPKEMTHEDIKNAIVLYANAAKRAERSGFDYLELQFGHGYLIAQFLSPSVNKRHDQYGESWENRIRFGLEVLEAVQHSSNLPVIIRLSAEEFIEHGWTFQDTLNLIPVLEQKGVTAFHVSAGTLCQTPNWYYQHMFTPKGKTWEFAKKIKEITDLPVITIGQINSFNDIQIIKQNAMADYIALGRAIIADPEFIPKYQKQNQEPLQHCLGCLDGCVLNVKKGNGLMCVVNPEIRKEYKPLVPVKTPKTIAIIGGGIAGMATAKYLKKRGHKVTIYEKNRLGGQFILAPLPPHKQTLQNLIDDLKLYVKDDVIFKEPLIDDLKKYDEVIVATGSYPIKAPFRCEMPYSWAEILEEESITDKNVVVVGGGLIGMEITHQLVLNNNTVTVIEMLEDVARDMNPITKKLTLKHIQETGKATIMVNTKVTHIENRKVYYEKNGEEGYVDNVDKLIITIGVRSNKELPTKLDENHIKYHVVGDAEKPGNAFTAMQSAYKLSLTI